MYNALNFIAIWLPRAFFGIIFVLAVWAYARIRRGSGLYLHTSPPLTDGVGIKRITLRGLVAVSVIFQFVYALLLTALQYFVWRGDPFSRLLLQDSLKSLPAEVTGGLGAWSGKLGYFLFYSWGHFWVGAIWSVIIALIFWLILKSLQKHKERFFHPGETEIGFLCALIVGWPDLILFLPLVFLSVILVSLYRLVFLKEAYTTLGWPFLLAVVLTFIAGYFFSAAIGLQSWKIY